MSRRLVWREVGRPNLLAGIASPAGEVRLANGDLLKRPADWNQSPNDGREIDERLLQSSLMSYAAAKGGESYSNKTDKRTGPNGTHSGLSGAEVLMMFEGLLGKDYDLFKASEVGRDVLYGKITAALIAGLVTGPASLVSDNAAHIVSDYAGSLVLDNAASYRTLALEQIAFKNALIYFTHPDERFYAIDGRIVAGTTDGEGRFTSTKPIIKAGKPVIVNAMLPFDRRLVGYLQAQGGENRLRIDLASTYVIEFLRHQARRRGISMLDLDLRHLAELTSLTRRMLDAGKLRILPAHLVVGRGDRLAADYATAMTRSDPELAGVWEKTLGERPSAVSTYAGTWLEGSDGDGSDATGSRLTRPWGLFIAESGAHHIRMVDGNGKITRVLGNFEGDAEVDFPTLAIDDVPAASASLLYPRSPALDAQGNLFFTMADFSAPDGKPFANQVVAMLCRAPGDYYGLSALNAGRVYRVAGNGALGQATPERPA